MGFTDLFIKDKDTGEIHRIGDDCHDMLAVDRHGIIHYLNLQNNCGCASCVGGKGNVYEFVPNMDKYGYAYDPRQ